MASFAAMGMVPSASADCVTDDTTVTCTGDHSDGIAKNSPGVEVLNVNSLTTDIEPDSGTVGVALIGTGSVQITYDGGDQDILTTGQPAAGIVGFSTGINGSDGSTVDLVAYSYGTDGTDGTSAGTVNIYSSGGISTDGEYAHGLFAVSQGANGGDGGDGSGGIGGNGGEGGNGGFADAVTVTNVSTISTSADNSQGIYAQSLGGEGGNGGSAEDLTVATAGSAGDSRDGSTVTVVNKGDLTTSGVLSNGILAQSLGGFGGDGGDAGSIFYSEGSDGVTGAAGGTVNVTNSGTLITYDDTAYGILAQSVGGGGGSGGDAGAIGSVGGSGAGGGAGGQVSAVNTGAITTYGDVSIGILAQSVGGGGGDGGSAAGITSIGGDGAAGADGDTVSGSHSGSISTSGIGSIGLLVQSIGGGGGHGAESDALVAIGGLGGGGGDGGSISFDTSGDVTTTGVRADAIQIQSVGGGGGKGGNAGSISPGVSITIGGAGGDGGDGDDVTVNEDNTAVSATATLSTTEDHSAGMAVSSIGGGGGSGGWALSAAGGALGVAIAVGGTGGGGGDGGAVSVKNNGTIHTKGNHSVGLSAQSTGGGGGAGGYAISISAGASGSVSVGVGGDGGDGGDGSTVDLTSWTDVTTEKHHSIGIIGSSVGGGGGNGGFSISVSASPEAAFDASIGGSGGTAGHSDTVTVTSTGTIYTIGDHSYGLVAQSIGGGGGNGGYSIGVDVSGMDGGSIGIGGDGDGGGNAGESILTNTGAIETEGDHAYAILAQSVGGGGGNGGHVIDASAASAGSAVVSIGGSGSGGGDADTVSAISVGDLTTSGQNSYALLAQSIGGGGGNGGYAIGGAGSLGASASVTIGGSGAGGGDGAKVTADSTGTVVTSGDLSHGLFAQSLGGGGGNGGYSIAGTLSTTVSASVAIGGSGAGGGDGGEVTLTNQGDVTTSGGHANALLAQSLGGGGGNGGFSAAGDVTISPEGAGVSVAVSIGGQGGAGGTSNTVIVNSKGALQTGGHSSSGIFAQSIGGGGGNGGASVEGTLSISSDVSVNAGVSIAGSGGTGSSSSSVHVVNKKGAITTGGENSTAILAQSIGGGGGNGGFSVAAAIEVSGDGGANVGVSLGGDGGSGNDGGVVTVTSDGDLTTAGNNASGILAQSLGGGGGNGGFSVAADVSNVNTVDVSISGAASDGGTANAVTVDNTGTIQTDGANSYGIQAQSLGGAGGNGGFSVAGSLTTSSSANISISGGGGSGGTSDEVSVDQTGEIITEGAGAHGIFAQSVGGGGGNGGFSVEGALTVSSESSATVGVSVAGGGGDGATSASVDVVNDGPIQVSGDNAIGILAQSVGGGGGNGGFSVSGNLTYSSSTSGSVGVSIGGDGGIGSYGDDVTVENSGAIVTDGANGTAILAQSIGGGGGNGGFSVTGNLVISDDSATAGVSVAGAGGDGSNGGIVEVTSVGNLSTSGDNAIGILAQSVGGGGGNGGFSAAFDGGKKAALSVSVGGAAADGGLSSTVSVDSTGTIVTAGSLSYGILAQSVGGSGGNGGFSLSGSLSTSASVGVSVGGGGGDGGTADDVTLEHTGSVVTSGAGAHGLFAQSVGGGGGTGGFSGAADITFEGDADIGVSIGGSGGDGGAAGAATLTSQDGTVIWTKADGAVGLFAQSVGGSGGDGGFSFAANLGLGNSGSSTTTIGVTIGGSGRSGGTGSTVGLTNSTGVVTVGDYSYGILAQSVGGSGGTGGLSVSGSANLSTDSTNSLNVAVGGGGGTGNTADTVTVDNSGNVSTSGGYARGLFVQSVGGGGGNGGLSFAGTLAGGGSEGSLKSVGVSVGGNGGTGGDGGEVQLTNSGDVTTTGYLAEGILAQSVGGGGGAGGLAAAAILSYKGDGTNLKINVAVGGTGGAGGIGEAVTLTNTGDIASTGVASTAIYAQSIGGGGGNGGSSFSGVIDLTKPGGGGEEDDDDDSNDRNLTVNVAIGGNAGDGASGGTVTVHNEGTLTTVLGSAKGIFAQSVGGGGGSGGASDAFAMEIGSCSNPALPGCETPDFTEKSLTVEVSIGGSGGEGGDGDTVTVTNKGGIQTSADGSDAIYAQSVGAGGGEGGNGTIGQDIITGLPADILDTADTTLNPPLAFWQEIGVNVGGSGGASGNGGAVSVTNENTLITAGDRSSGIFAQSIGGGGGQGGNTDGGFVGVTVGGSGGAAGDSDAVTVSNSGDIRTSGDGSLGIFAQSVGGGGGVSGTVSQGFFGTDIDLGIGVGVSQDGGDGGNGGDVYVATSSTIITTGDGAHGVWAQSVGGGGGTAGSSSSDLGLNFAGTAGDDGDAGTVTVLHTGDITTTGDGSVGIFAQSASGGADGNTGDASDDYALNATGTGKTVSVSVNSSVVTSGDNSIGIVAQSIGLNGDGQIFINIGEDSVITGGTDPDGTGIGDDPVGILVLDGYGNVIENNGIVGTKEGVLGIAIETRETEDNEDTAISDLVTPDTVSELESVENIGSTILNNGTMTGSIFLADDADNKVINTGTLNAGDTIDLGSSDNQFINDGILSPGGADSISTTTINGDFLQTEEGEILLDVNFADNNNGVNTSDEIDVSGTSDLSGTVVVNALNGAFVEPDETGEVTILTSFEEFDDLTIVASDTEVVTYELRTDDDGNVFLAWDVDFTPSAGDFNSNQTAIGNYLVNTIDAGEPENLTAVLNAVLEAPDAATLADYYNQLSAEPYLQTEQATVLSNRQFGRRLLQCPKNSLSPETEGCSWMQLDAQRSKQDGEFESLGYEETAVDLQLGIGGRLSERMNALFGVSYAQTNTDTEDYATSEGFRLQGGAGLSYENNGGAIFSIAAIGGFASYNHDRTQTLTGSTVMAQGNQRLYFGSGQARIVQQAHLGDIYFAPEIEAWGGYFRHGAISETGAGASNLDIEAGSNAYGSVRPGLTIATEFIAEDGSVLRPYIGGGVTYSLVGKNNSKTSLTATMQGDDDLVPAFTVSRTPEDPYFDAQLGLDWASPVGVTFRIGGTAQFAKNYRSYGGSLRLVATF